MRHDLHSSNVGLVTRVPLAIDRALHHGVGFAHTAGVQAVLAAWALGEAAKRQGERARAWRAVTPHPDRGMDVAPSAALGFGERLLKPRLASQGDAFGHALMEDAAEDIDRDGVGLMPHRHPDGYKISFAVDVGPALAMLEVVLIRARWT